MPQSRISPAWIFLAIAVVTNIVLFGINILLMMAGITLGWWYFTLAIIITFAEAGFFIYRKRRASPW